MTESCPWTSQLKAPVSMVSSNPETVMEVSLLHPLCDAILCYVHLHSLKVDPIRDLGSGTHLEIFDIVFNMHYGFQHMLKFSTCCFNMFLT